MELYARQGDLVFDKLGEPIEAELTPERDLVLAGDSSGHMHTVRGSMLAMRDGRRTLLRLAEPTVVEHASPNGHKTIELEAGDYEVRPLRERGDGFDRAVED